MSQIIGFHAHVYFTQDRAEAAKDLCLQASKLFGVVMGRMHARPVGPHPMPSCQLEGSPEQFGRMLPWLMENRHDLVVLCHGQSGDHLKDHTHNTFWLGAPQALKLEMFAPADQLRPG